MNKPSTVKSAQKRSQLYLDAITNFIRCSAVDVKSQAEERLILEQLKAKAEYFQKAAG